MRGSQLIERVADRGRVGRLLDELGHRWRQHGCPIDTESRVLRPCVAPYADCVARIRVALCQINTIVGNLDRNVELILAAYDEAEAGGADIAVFPELAITGYPPEDLVLKPGFVAANRDALDKVAARTGRCAAVVGFVDAGRDLHNAAAVCSGGQVLGTYHKRLLPNYAVFDEQRYFTPGSDPLQLFSIAGVKVGVSICEDAWSPDGPIDAQADGGAELVVNLNASPYYRGRLGERERMLATRAEDAHCHLVYVNQVGGQDELVFDGASLVFDHDGELLARAAAAGRGDRDRRARRPPRVPQAPARPTRSHQSPGAARRACVRRGARPRRVRACRGHQRAAAAGCARCTTRSCSAPATTSSRTASRTWSSPCRAASIRRWWPSSPPMRSGQSMCTASPCRAAIPPTIRGPMPTQLADALGIDLRTIAIEPAHAAFLEMLAPSFAGLAEDLTEENLQPRIRGMLLMALSNKFRGWLVLTTGNKSELAVGYSTLYGDTAGGFAVIRDVPKLLVYDLCRDRNERAGRALIPESVLTKPPSAELRPDQRDDESLPPYEVLDPILEAYVENDLTRADLIAAGFDPTLVERITHLVDGAEYKRRQNPPGPRITTKAFGKDRRMPITNGFRG